MAVYIYSLNVTTNKYCYNHREQNTKTDKISVPGDGRDSHGHVLQVVDYWITVVHK